MELNDKKRSDSLNLQGVEKECPTLSDYLGERTCIDCHQNCTLLKPNCHRGESQAMAARTEYEETFYPDK